MPRPTDLEQARRRRRFWLELAQRGSIEEAATAAGLEFRQLVRLLDEPEAMEAARGLLRQPVAA